MLPYGVPKSLPGLGRQGEIVVDALSPLSACSVLVVTDKGGEQHKGEKGKDVALCILDGMDGVVMLRFIPFCVSISLLRWEIPVT